MTHWSREERQARGIGGVLNDHEVVLGLVDRWRTEVENAASFFWSIVRSPQALALLTVAGVFLIGAQLPVHAESAGMTPRLGSQNELTSEFVTSGNIPPSSMEGGVGALVANVDTDLTDEQALAERYYRIQSAQALLQANPDAWNVAPESCRKSMTRFWMYDGDSSDQTAGSASVIQSERVVSEEGVEAWIYRFITADHAVRGPDGNIMQNGEVILFPGSQTDQDHRYWTLDYQQFRDENGVPQDAGMVSVWRTGAQAEINDPDFVPLGVDNVRGLGDLVASNVLYSFDYPGLTRETPQFTVAAILGDAAYSNGDVQKIMEPLTGSSTVAMGSSGGAMCDVDGNHVGVATGYEGEWPSKYYAEGNPTSIQQQIKDAIVFSMNRLAQTGFKVSNQ